MSRRGVATGRIRVNLHRLVLVATLLYALWLVSVQQVRLWQLQREIRAVNLEMEEIRARKAALSHELERLRDPLGIEVEARDRLGLVYPGEIPYMTVPAQDANAAASAGAPVEGAEAQKR